MGDQELKVTILPDLSKLKDALKAIGVLSVDGTTTTGAGSKEQKEQTKVLGDISAGVFKGNAALEVIKLVTSAFEPFLKPLAAMIRILVLLIFLPLLPFLKPAFQALAGLLKFVKSITSGSENREAVSPLVSILAGIGGAIGGIIGFGLAGPIGLGIGTLLGSIAGFLIGSLGVLLGEVLAAIINFMTGLDWYAIVQTIVNIIAGIAGFVGEIIVALVDILSQIDWTPIVAGITGFIENLFGKGESLFESVIKALPEPLKEAWDDLVNAVDTGKKLIFGDRGEGTTGVWGALRRAIQLANFALFGGDGKGGLWKELMDAVQSAGKALATVLIAIANALNPIIQALGIGKPAGGGAPVTPGLSTADAFARITAGLFLGPAGALLPLPKLGDFISRPGQAPIPFSPSDTIIGSRGGGGGGMTVNNTFNVSADVDGDSMKRKLRELNRELIEDLRRSGTFGGRIFNV